MIPLSISTATEVYTDAARCEIIRHYVDHPALSEFSRSLRAFVQSLGNEASEEFLQRSIGTIRRLGFTFCSTPLPFSEAAAASGIDWGNLHQQVRLCKQFFPDAHEKLGNLVQLLEDLSTEVSSPFIETLEQLHQKSGDLCVLLQNPRWNQAVAAFFARNATFGAAKVVSPSQLCGRHLNNILVAIGPCGWFPEYVFLAPRVTTIHVICPRWIRDNWKPGPILLHNFGKSDGRSCNHCVGAIPRVVREVGKKNHTPADILPVDLLTPKPPLSNALTFYDSHTDDDIEKAPALLCLLSGQRAAFVAAHDGSYALIIDMSEIGQAAVRRVPSRELEPGHYLLLRTSGGGDFIAQLADRILGNRAGKRRSEQAEWKMRLIAEATERYGPHSRRELSHLVSSELRLKSLSQALPANIHYWMSSKCIRPRKIENFVAILTFAGLEQQSQELWSAMGDIVSAHRQAGQAIRRMLLSKIATSSLELLIRDGEMEFELGDEDGGTLSAFQVTEVNLLDFELPIDRIGVLLDIEDSLWPA